MTDTPTDNDDSSRTPSENRAEKPVRDSGTERNPATTEDETTGTAAAGNDDSTQDNGSEPSQEPEVDSDSEDVADVSTGDGEDEAEDLTEVVPELHPNVYRAPFEGYDVTDPEDLADAVGEIDPQASVTVEELARRKRKLEDQVEHYKERAKKKQKEFQNFKQRKNDETEEIKDTATKEFIKEALPIRDNLTRALEQESGDIRSGVELIQQEFDELLEKEGVTVIDPEQGADVNPEIHEVMTRVQSDVPEGKIDSCFRPGYSMEGVLIRPARVTVSNGTGE